MSHPQFYHRFTLEFTGYNGVLQQERGSEERSQRWEEDYSTEEGERAVPNVLFQDASHARELAADIASVSTIPLGIAGPLS